MKQEVYNTYKISVDGSDGKFVITSIQNKDGDKLDSDNESTEFTSEDEALKAAKEEIDKKASNKSDDNNTEQNAPEETVTQSSFDKLFNQILLEYNLESDWKKVIAESPDEDFQSDPETDSTYMKDNEEGEVTVDSLIQKVKAAESKEDKQAVIDDIKKNNSDLLNDFIKKLQDITNNPPEGTSDEDVQKIQEIIEYAEK